MWAIFRWMKRLGRGTDEAAAGGMKRFPYGTLIYVPEKGVLRTSGSRPIALDPAQYALFAAGDCETLELSMQLYDPNTQFVIPVVVTLLLRSIVNIREMHTDEWIPFNTPTGRQLAGVIECENRQTARQQLADACAGALLTMPGVVVAAREHAHANPLHGRFEVVGREIQGSCGARAIRERLSDVAESYGYICVRCTMVRDIDE